MPFTIERNDLAQMSVDAIVVTANEGLQINGGAGLAVARAAGLEQMQAACNAIGGCPTGSAVSTPAFALDAQHVVHVVGPIWQGGTHNELAVLRSAYDSALNCAYETGAHSIALPLISAHTFGLPVRLSFETAVEAVKEFLDRHDCDVHIVLYGHDAMAVGASYFDDIAEYIDDHYVEQHTERLSISQMLALSDERELNGPPLPGASSYEWQRYAEPRPSVSAPAASQLPVASASSDGQRPSDAGQEWEHPMMSPFFPEASPKQQRLFGRFADVVDRVRENAAERKAREKEEKRARKGVCETGASILREERIDAAEPIVESEAEYHAAASASIAESESDYDILAGTAFGGKFGASLFGDKLDYEATFAAPAAAPMPMAAPKTESLSSWLDKLDAPFSTTLLALIDARGLTDAQVYKRANMSRQLFSKIRSDATYRPTKKTVLALAIALDLDLTETNDLLRRAGFALSHSNKADVIVEYFIVNQKYDIYAINEALYAFDQPLL